MIIDPNLYGRRVQHTHIDSRDRGLLRGTYLDGSESLSLLVEIETAKGKGALMVWALEDCELIT